MTDLLEIPEFLRGSRPGPKPRPLRWTRMRGQRPEGDKWLAAERWQVTLGQNVGDIPPGTRLLWVLYADGRKWAELRDAEAYAKVPAETWARIANRGRKLS